MSLLSVFQKKSPLTLAPNDAASRTLSSAQKAGEQVKHLMDPVSNIFVPASKKIVDKTMQVLNPGSTYVEPALKKKGINPKAAMAIGLFVDLAAPGPGEFSKGVGATNEVLYHGTNAAAKIKKEGFKLMDAVHGQQVLGKGIYLTPTKEEAKNFGKKVLEVNLKKGVKLLDADPGQVWKLTIEANQKYPELSVNESIARIVQEKGYGGIRTIGAGNKGETYISVFNPDDIEFEKVSKKR